MIEFRGGTTWPFPSEEAQRDLLQTPLGIVIDRQHRLWIIEHGAVLRMTPSGKLETWIKTPRIRWADALSFGPDGWLYLADSDIPNQVMQSREHIASNGPYHVFRFRPGVQGVPGQ